MRLFLFRLMRRGVWDLSVSYDTACCNEWMVGLSYSDVDATKKGDVSVKAFAAAPKASSQRLLKCIPIVFYYVLISKRIMAEGGREVMFRYQRWLRGRSEVDQFRRIISSANLLLLTIILFYIQHYY